MSQIMENALSRNGEEYSVLFFVKEYFPVRIFWFLIGGLSTVPVRHYVSSLLTIRKLGLLNNQQAIEISKEK